MTTTASTGAQTSGSGCLKSLKRLVGAFVIRLIRIVVLFYGLAAIVLFFGQGALIFQGHATQGLGTSVVRLPPRTELISIPTPSGKVMALFGPALTPSGGLRADRADRPTLLYFYGNAMCMADALWECETFRRLGVNILIPDYLGYGMSGGAPGEGSCYTTADAAYNYLLSRKDVNHGKIVASGCSLGAAVAIDLASRKKVAGLATFCAFTSMADVGRRYFQFFPVSLLLIHRFDNETKIHHVTCPILLGHGTLDNIAPFPMMEALARAAGGPVTIVRIEGAGHGDFFDTGGERVLGPFGAFLNRL